MSENRRTGGNQGGRKSASKSGADRITLAPEAPVSTVKSASAPERSHFSIAVRVFRAPSFAIAGLGVMRMYFWVGVALVLIGFLWCFAELLFEPWLIERPPWIQLFGFALLVFLLDIFLIRGVSSRAPIELVTYIRPSSYAADAVIAGIAWDAHLTDLRAAITNPSGDDYDNLDLSLKPNSWVHKAAIVGENHGCVLEPIEGSTIRMATARESRKLTMGATKVGSGFDTTTAVEMSMRTWHRRLVTD